MAPPLQSQIQSWDTRFTRQYVRGIPYSPYMGRANRDGARMPILLNYEPQKGAKTVNMPYIADLKGNGVQGTTRLAGNEEELATYNQAVTVNYNRHAVLVKEPEEFFTGLDLRNEARVALKDWATRGLRRDITTALMAFDTGSYLMGKNADNASAAARTPLEAYLAVPEATKDAYLAANTDRFLFGAAVSNHAGNDHSTALGNVDAINDRMTVSKALLAKELAESTEQAITPFMADEDEGREQWVMFLGVRAFRDLKQDPVMQQALREAAVRGSDNPLFRSGDLVYEDIIFRQIRDIPVIPGVGAAGVDVQPSFLVGAGAVGVAWGQMPRSKTKDEDDYDFEIGVGIQEVRGVAKLGRGGVQNGVVTLYTAAPATA